METHTHLVSLPVLLDPLQDFSSVRLVIPSTSLLISLHQQIVWTRGLTDTVHLVSEPSISNTTHTGGVILSVYVGEFQSGCGAACLGTILYRAICLYTLHLTWVLQTTVDNKWCGMWHWLIPFTLKQRTTRAGPWQELKSWTKYIFQASVIQSGCEHCSQSWKSFTSYTI